MPIHAILKARRSSSFKRDQRVERINTQTRSASPSVIMDEEVMDDVEVMIDPFILVCEEFIAAFERMLPHDINRPHGRYEQAVQLAFNRIEALEHVERVTLSNRFTFLVSEENEMALYTRCVRQQSLRRNGYGRSRRRRAHEFGFLDRNNVVTTGEADLAMRAFFALYNVRDADYTVVIPFGTVEHETVGFFRRNHVTYANERRMLRAHFYDCNDGSNVIEICRRFLRGTRCEADIYSNAIHPFVNENGQCGHLSFLEIFLCFYMHDNPFHRDLITRPLTGNRFDGHHGPMLYDPNRPRSNRYRNRNRNIPRNQQHRE